MKSFNSAIYPHPNPRCGKLRLYIAGSLNGHGEVSPGIGPVVSEWSSRRLADGDHVVLDALLLELLQLFGCGLCCVDRLGLSHG